MNLEPSERCVLINKLADEIGVREGAIYLRLKSDFNLKKVGKYLVYAGINEKVPTL